MKFVDEYRDERLARTLADEIARRAVHHWVLMEICGGQTHTIMRYGLDELLPPNVELVHGPGCPVCVTPLELVDKAIEIASQPDVTLVSYGDMLRVPGSCSDLFRVRAAGGDVRIVYSPMDALRIARAHPGRRVVFFAIGFETTAPANAMVVWQARAEVLRNFSMLAAHARVPPAMRMLLGSPANRVQGVIAPGHVCTVMGCREYAALSREFHVPVVVGGFEPIDLLAAILSLVKMLEAGCAGLGNQYTRSASYEGNRLARRIVRQVFEVCDRNWRGIGVIPRSGLRLRPEFAGYDADRIFGAAGSPAIEPPGCIAGAILRGLQTPGECSAFAHECTPEHPLGAPMVSSEGPCAAYYRFRRSAAPCEVLQ